MSGDKKIIIDDDRCAGCANYLFNLKCTAFPDGIPEEILNGENDHSKPLKEQDNDIVYEKIKNQQ